MTQSGFAIHRAADFRYIDQGAGSQSHTLLLLHGMLGQVGNWQHTIEPLAAAGYRVLVPILPVYELPMSKSNVPGLVEYVEGFLEAVGVDTVVACGNSLGGHIALLLTLRRPEMVRALVLSGASGLWEVDMGQSTMKRQDREFIRERAAITFYDPRHATRELVDDVLEVVNDRGRALRLIRMARSVKAENVRDSLGRIDIPTLLVWGREDEITPPEVAETFHELIPGSELQWIEKCGHAPMMEHPELFNRLILDFLGQIAAYDAVA